MKYRAEIDGLRAVAVLPVILFHAGFSLFSGGFIGVDVFFVISGYLITTLLIDDLEHRRFSLVYFYERRARRILPALFLVMLLCIPPAWLWMLPEQMKDFSQSLVAVTLFGSNILFWRKSGYFAPSSEENPLLHTWSLAVEEQYYLLFPLFLMLAWRFGKNRVFWMIVLLAAISLLVSEWGWRHRPTANFYLAPTRAWELFAGSIAAFMLRKHAIKPNNPLSLLGLAAIIASVFYYDDTTPFPSLYALAPVLGTVLIILFADKTTLTAKLLSVKPLVGIGLISYSAYLWHQPLFAFTRIRLLEYPDSGLMLALSVISLLLAALSWKYVEQPFRDKTRFSRRSIFTLSALMAAAVITFGLAGHFTQGFEHRAPEEIKPLLAIKTLHDKQRDDGGCNRQDDETRLERCVYGNAGAVNIALVGDSHASALANELGNYAGSNGIGVRSYTKNACPFVKGFTNSGNNKCHEFVDKVLKDIENSPQVETIIVVGRMGYYLSDDDYDNGVGGKDVHHKNDISSVLGVSVTEPSDIRKQAILEAFSETITQLSRDHPNKRILLLTPIPEQGWNVPKRLARGAMWGLDSLPNLPRAIYDERNAAPIAVMQKLADLPNVDIAHAARALCTQTHCLATENATPLYYDDDHLSNAGARKVISILTGSLLK